MKFAALFAAFVSVFGLTSCLGTGESGPQQYQSLVTVESSYMGYTTLYADEYPGVALYPTNTADLTTFGITSSTKRAMVVYTFPEGQDMTSTQLNVTLENGVAWPVYDISNRPDTCAAYTDPIVNFSDFTVMYTFKSGFIARNRYMNVGYQYNIYSNKAPEVVMLHNRVSNDTIYLDFKVKKVESAGQTTLCMDTYDLHSCISELGGLVPKNDSVYVTVVAETSVGKDSITNRCKRFY